MSLFVFDVESDGPAPGLYSMVSLGVVRLDEDLQTSFYGQMAPISQAWIPEALAVSGVSREEHLGFADPKAEMERFAKWVEESNISGRPTLISDNPAFDWQFVNYYFHAFLGRNPFGHSARRIGDFWAGLERNFGDASGFKKLRKTAHTHHPVDDARGNGEALLAMAKKHGVRLPGCQSKGTSAEK